jgi:hypothetical protein
MKIYKTFALTILASFFTLAVGCNFPSEKEKYLEIENRNKSEKHIVASVPQIFEDYRANEVAADNKYKEKVVELKGTVVNISEFSEDVINVTLEHNLGLRSDCLFRNELHRDEIADIQKGFEIKVRGKFFSIKDDNLRMAGCWFP